MRKRASSSGKIEVAMLRQIYHRTALSGPRVIDVLGISRRQHVAYGDCQSPWKTGFAIFADAAESE